jgi:hypothetical protein
MDDLVRRLWDCSTFGAEGAERLCSEAADRIEQLEAALREICDGPRDADKSYAELFAEVCWEARAALGEKKSDD